MEAGSTFNSYWSSFQDRTGWIRIKTPRTVINYILFPFPFTEIDLQNQIQVLLTRLSPIWTLPLFCLWAIDTLGVQWQTSHFYQAKIHLYPSDLIAFFLSQETICSPSQSWFLETQIESPPQQICTTLCIIRLLGLNCFCQFLKSYCFSPPFCYCCC